MNFIAEFATAQFCVEYPKHRATVVGKRDVYRNLLIWCPISRYCRRLFEQINIHGVRILSAVAIPMLISSTSPICSVIGRNGLGLRTFIAMELLEGQTLRYLISGKPLRRTGVRGRRYVLGASTMRENCENDMLVLGSIHVAAQYVAGTCSFTFDADFVCPSGARIRSLCSLM